MTASPACTHGRNQEAPASAAAQFPQHFPLILVSSARLVLGASFGDLAAGGAR
jgi:hypothetical protein